MPAQGSANLNPKPTSLDGTAIPVLVARYLYRGPAAEEEESPFELIPNVRCLQIDNHEGPEPPVARFQYVMSDLLEINLGWPSQFERLWPIDAQGDYIVKTDDEIVVFTLTPEGQPIYLFWGFAQVPQIDVAAGHQGVTFSAISVAVRLWDEPITTRNQRQTDKATSPAEDSNVIVQLPCRFNPANNSIGTLGGYTPNCVGEHNFTVNESEDPDITGDFPVFIDPTIKKRGDPDLYSYWFLSDAIKYLCAHHQSPEDPTGFPYVVYPTFNSLDDILGLHAPSAEGILDDGATVDNINIRDYDASNKPVADAMADLLSYGGFTMVFQIETDTNGKPETHLLIKRRDSFSKVVPKPLYLAALGQNTLNLAANNATALHLARDCNAIVNEFDLETTPKQVEVTVYLSPGYTPSPGDADPSHVTKWHKGNLGTASEEEQRKYRWYVADECGDGHWDGNSFVTDKPLDFTDIFPLDEDDKPSFVRRYRPPSHRLLSKDVKGKNLAKMLEACKGQTNPDPAISTAEVAAARAGENWVVIPGGWKLLEDRLGIEVDVDKPDEWATSAAKKNGAETLPRIDGVKWFSDPTDTDQIAFRLTTVIEADQRLEINSPKRVASPTKWSRSRSSDAKDHFQYCEISPGSRNYETQKDVDGQPSNGTDPLIVRDDTKAAQTHADQLRAAHEFPRVAGSVTIPYWTDYYQIGDQVKLLQGRNASFQINVGADQGEKAAYPWVTAFTWMFEKDRQETVLQLSDRRAEPRNL